MKHARMVLAVAAFFGLLGLGIVVWYERMQECRRVHPLWYCVSE